MTDDTSLLLPKSKVEEEIRKQLNKGQELLGRNITSPEEFNQSLSDHKFWKSKTTNLLGNLFSDYSISNMFHSDDPKYEFSPDPLTEYKRFLEGELERLELLLARLPLMRVKSHSDDQSSSANVNAVV